MSEFRSSKRAKELKRKAHKKAKEERKREREKNAARRGPDDDIDWSQAVGFPQTETSEAEEQNLEPGGDPGRDEAGEDGQKTSSSDHETGAAHSREAESDHKS